MAKKSAIEKNKSRIKKVERFKNKRVELKKLIMNKKTSQEDHCLWKNVVLVFVARQHKFIYEETIFHS